MHIGTHTYNCTKLIHIPTQKHILTIEMKNINLLLLFI